MVSKKIERLRNKIRRKKSERRADKRARERSERKGSIAMERARKERRIEQNNPEGISETVSATSRQTKLLASELGVTQDRAQQVINKGNEILDKSAESAGGMSELDLDGDGDTDLLPSIDPVDDSVEQDFLNNPNNNMFGSGRKQSQEKKKQEIDPASGEFERDLLDLDL